MNITSWVLSGLSIIGSILNAFGKIAGFYIWIIANTGWIVEESITHNWAQVPMWAVYNIISVIGIIIWKKKKVGA